MDNLSNTAVKLWKTSIVGIQLNEKKICCYLTFSNEDCEEFYSFTCESKKAKKQKKKVIF